MAAIREIPFYLLKIDKSVLSFEVSSGAFSLAAVGGGAITPVDSVGLAFEGAGDGVPTGGPDDEEAISPLS